MASTWGVGLLVLAAACRDPILTGPSSLECTERSAEELALTSKLAPVATVAQVSWQTRSAGSSSVYFQPEDGPTYQTAVQQGDAGTWEANLIGSPDHTSVQWQVVGTDDEGTWCSPTMELVTGGHSVALPEFLVDTVDADARDDGFLAVVLFTSDTPIAVLLDRDGRVVWAYGTFIGGYFRAALSLDRTALVVNPQAALDNPGAITRLDLVTGEVDDAVEGGHTDFVEVADRVYYALRWDVREVDDEGRLSGDVLVRIQPDGTAEEVWNVWDHLTMPDPDLFMPGGHPWGDDIRDWTHLNGLSYDAASDSVIMTSGARESVISVDGSTGETNWKLGGPEGEFDSPELIWAPHSAQLLADGEVLVFNRGTQEGVCSTAERIALDPDAHSAHATWSYESDECVQVYFLGEALHTPSGNTFVDFTTAGQIDQVDAEGRLVQRISLDLGAATGFATYVPSLY